MMKKTIRPRCWRQHLAEEKCWRVLKSCDKKSPLYPDQLLVTRKMVDNYKRMYGPEYGWLLLEMAVDNRILDYMESIRP